MQPQLERHGTPPLRCLRVGVLNIRSVNRKTENVSDLFDEHGLSTLILTEAWHKDADSAAIKRLHSWVSTVLDNIHFVNHGGLVVISKPGIHIAKVDTWLMARTFEHLCCWVRSGNEPFIIVAIYRPGSQSVRELFFTKLSTLLKSLGTFSNVIWVVVDTNIHLERPTDNHCQKFEELIRTYNVRQYVHEPTYDQVDLLDVVIAADD